MSYGHSANKFMDTKPKHPHEYEWAAVDVSSGPLLAAIAARCGSTMLRDICAAATDEECAQLNREIAAAPMVSDVVGFYRQKAKISAWRKAIRC